MKPGANKAGGAVVLAIVAVVATMSACGSSKGSSTSFYIASCANYPTLQPGYHVDVREPPGSVARGDIVVFKRPPTSLSSVVDSVMRIVGLPGEMIGASAGRLTVDGRAVPEPYLPSGTATPPFNPVQIPAGEYFVLGDNRANSADSRSFGPIPTTSIIGKVIGIRKGAAPAGDSCPVG